MSIRESLQIYCMFNVDEYLEVLQKQYGTEFHPTQKGAFVVDGLPFYKPQKAEEYIFILSFNYMPLASALVWTLFEHPELVPADTHIRWMQEQDLVFDGAIGDFISWESN